MPYAYTCTPGTVIRRNGQTLVAETTDGEKTELHIATLSALILIGRVSVTAQAQRLLLDSGVPAAFLSKRGACLGRLEPARGSAVHLRLAQYAAFTNPDARLTLARRVVRNKLQAMTSLVRRYRSNHPDKQLAHLDASLASHIASAESAGSIAELLGIEGSATRAYFAGFATMNRSKLHFPGRQRRPPRDPINAMLSFGYTLLATEAAALAAALGLEPYLGVLHDPSPRRPALAMDVIETFRHLVVDRVVLTSINTGRFKQADFAPQGDGVRMQPHALKRFICIYEQAMNARLPPPADSRQTGRLQLLDRLERIVHWLRKDRKPMTDARRNAA